MRDIVDQVSSTIQRGREGGAMLQDHDLLEVDASRGPKASPQVAQACCTGLHDTKLVN